MENLKEYVKNMKEYEEICQYIGFGTPKPISIYGPWDIEKFRAPPSYSLWDLEKFRILSLHMGLGTRKNSTPELPPGLWDLEKFRSSYLHLHKILCSASIQALGFQKMLSFPFLRLQPVGKAPSVVKCEVRGVTLLSPPCKL